MGRESFTPGINRRRLLGSVAAAATANGVVPALARVEVDVEVVPSAARAVMAAQDLQALKVSTPMAKRLSAITRRNKLGGKPGCHCFRLCRNFVK